MDIYSRISELSGVYNNQQMVNKKLIDYRAAYKRLIMEDTKYDELYKWEALKNFQDNWDIDALDFRDMYDKSVQSNIENNLWASQYFFPKKVMLTFIDFDEQKVRSMFRQLFDEDLEIMMRIDQFVSHCDELLAQVAKEYPNYKKHFHDGYRVISVYLCFRYPMNYSIYKYTEFKGLMEKIGAFDIPGTNELGRFFRVMRTIYNKLAEDQELLDIHKQLRRESKYYQGESLLLAQDFYWCCDRFDIDKYTN